MYNLLTFDFFFIPSTTVLLLRQQLHQKKNNLQHFKEIQSIENLAKLTLKSWKLKSTFQSDLIKDFDGLFNQFIEQRIKCCKSSIQTLIFLIKKKPNLIHQQEKREILLNWLIGNTVDIEDDKTENWHFLLQV